MENNGFNLELILQKASSDEIRNEMIVGAVERGITVDSNYFQQAVRILESKKNYQAIAFLYSREKSPFYDSNKAVEYFKQAAELYGFKKDIESKIGTVAVLKEMGKKGFNAVCKMSLYLFNAPTSFRKGSHDFEESEGFFWWGLIGNIFASGTDIGLLSTYIDTKDSRYLIFPALHIIPNVVSGLYEWYHYEKDKIQEKLDKEKWNREYEMRQNKLKDKSENANELEKKIAPVLPQSKPLENYDAKDYGIDETDGLNNHYERGKIAQ